MTPINNQTFQNFTRTQPKAVLAQSHDRFSTGRGPQQSRSFESMLEGAGSRPASSTSAKSLSEGQQRQISSSTTNIGKYHEYLNAIVSFTLNSTLNNDQPLPFRINLQSGVGAKALHDLPQIGPLTRQQLVQLVIDLDSDILNSFSDPSFSFDTKLEQLKLANLMLSGFDSMKNMDGKPGLSATDIRRTAANDGNPNDLSGRDLTLSSIVNRLNAQVSDALKGNRDIDLRSGVGAKALRDLDNIGALTRQQTLTLRSDILKGIQQLIKTNPAAVTSTQLDQLSLASLMLNGFERNAAEDGKPGLSAEDLRQVAARTGDRNVLSRRDT